MIKKIVFTALMLCATQAMAQGSKIAAIVNGDIITSSDLNDRQDTFLFLSKIPLNEQTASMVKQKVLHQAIDEKLKLQEAEKNGVSVAKSDIDNAVKNFEKQNGTLKSNNLSERAFRQQVKADVAWSRLLGQKAYEAKNITQKEIEDARAMALKDINTPKRMLSEIYILKNKAKNIGQLVETLKNDSRFDMYAMQFSDAPSASKGGKLGWVNVGRFDDVIETELKKMKDGDISRPILSGNGYYIFKLEKNFDPKNEKPYVPTIEEMKAFLQNKKMEMFVQDYSQKMRQSATIELR